MEINLLPLDVLEAEIRRRKQTVISEIRAKINEHQRAIAELEAQIPGREKHAKRPTSQLTLGEKSAAILSALADGGEVLAAAIADKVGFDGAELRLALNQLVAEGQLKKSGAARGTRYKLA